MLNAYINLLQIFLPDINHSVYVSAGVGATQFSRIEHYSSDKRDIINFKQDLVFGFDYSLKAGYAYTFGNRLSLGAYFEYQSIPEMGVFGLSLGKEF